MAEVLQVAVIASTWWANKICDTANLANYNIGTSNSTGNDIFSLICSLKAISLSPTPEAAKAFQLELQEIIMRELTNNPEKGLTLSCEMYPNELLREAAEKAGIDINVFPVNRTTTVSIDKVLVSDGKDQPFSILQTA